MQPKKDSSVGVSGGRLLLQWLDVEPSIAERRFGQIRSKLIRFFSAERLPFPEDLADETISRVGKVLDEGRIVSCKPETFFHSVAINVSREERRRVSKQSSLPEDAEFTDESGLPSAGIDESPRAMYLNCISKCLQSLEEEERSTIIEYYNGIEPGDQKRNRRQLAAALGTTSKALTSRAVRLRRKLESCVKACVLGSEKGKI